MLIPFLAGSLASRRRSKAPRPARKEEAHEREAPPKRGEAPPQRLELPFGIKGKEGRIHITARRDWEGT